MVGKVSVIHLLDNDFLIKLARWDLLFDYLTAYKIPVSNVRAIISLRRRLYQNGRPNLRLCGTAVAVGRLDAFLKIVKPPIPTDPSFTAAATGIPNFDDGEVVLVSALCAGGGQYVYTGDKRAIIAMASFKNTEYDAKFRNRVVCLEQALLAIIDDCGYAYVRQKMSADLAADAGMETGCFPLAAQTPEVHVRGYLNKKIQELQHTCGGILALNVISLGQPSSPSEDGAVA